MIEEDRFEENHLEDSRFTNNGIYTRLRLLLQVSEAANSQLELTGVLEAVMRVLAPILPIDAIELVTRDATMLTPRRLWTTPGQIVPPQSTTGSAPHRELEPGEPLPFAGSATQQVIASGRPRILADSTDGKRFPEDEVLAARGVRYSVRNALVTQDDALGSIAFCRRASSHIFSAKEIEVIEDISRPIATAIANSLAYGQIGKEKEQLRAENLVLREEIDQQAMFEEIVGSSPELRRVLDLVERVAATDSTVLISGETGTGKELVARAIHRLSKRAGRALIKVNCATLPEGLVMSELFGHEKGAFTGATQRRIGRFEAANHGSIFLDEVGELAAEIQAALLRVLQEGEFERVGGNQAIPTDVRVIAATNRDLSAEVAQQRFRPDLFYRLNVFPIFLPPLRERSDDIPILVEYFAARYSARLGKHFHAVERRTMETLRSYPWPGNVRELQNIIERAVILCDGDVLRVEPDALGATGGRATTPELESQLRQQELKLIETALAEARGRIAGPHGAAARLKLPPSTLEYKIRKLKIDKFGFRRLRSH